MLLSKLMVSLREKKIDFSYNKLYIKKLQERILFLNQVKSSKNIKSLSKRLKLWEVDAPNIKIKQKLISYIINIKFSESNTLVNITDINGNPRFSLSAGVVGLKGKQKRYQPAALIKILKIMFSKINFVGTKPVALHFFRAKRFHILLAIRLLKKKIFINTIRNYNLKPYNGCRPKKLKRLKRRKK